jgi:hypothetical protein
MREDDAQACSYPPRSIQSFAPPPSHTGANGSRRTVGSYPKNKHTRSAYSETWSQRTAGHSQHRRLTKLQFFLSTRSNYTRLRL